MPTALAERLAAQMAGLFDYIDRHHRRVLWMVFFAAVIIRRMLTFMAGDLPSIQPDEMRYFHIAKSIYADGQILFRGQPMFYPNILYPILIGPLFLLPENINIYRVIQIFNILCMSAAMSPAYGIARELTGNKKSALLLSLLTLILPDMVLTRNIMAESVAHPLVLATLYMVIKALRKPDEIGRWAMVGILCVLLYTLKPVYLSLGIACIIVLGMNSLKKRDRQSLTTLCILGGTMLAGYLLFMFFLRVILRADVSQQELYATQTAPFTFSHILQTLDGLMKYGFYHLLVFGVIPVAVAFSLPPQCRDYRAHFVRILLWVMGISMLITVYIIYVDELIHQGGVPMRVHVRYTAMYFPVFLMLLFVQEAQGLRLGMKGEMAVALALLGVAVYGVNGFSNEYRYPVDSMLMAGLFYQSGAWNGLTMYLPFYGTLITAYTVPALRNGLTKGIRSAMMAVMVLMLLINSYMAYQSNRHGTDSAVVADARQAISMTGHDAWMIFRDGESMFADTVAIDILARGNMNAISFSELIACTDANGVAQRMTPNSYGDEQFLYTNAVNPIVPANHLILSADLALNFASATPIQFTDNKRYAVIRAQSGQPWIHSGLIGFDERWIGQDSRFVLYDRPIRAKGIFTLRLLASSGHDQNATMRLQLPDGNTYSFTLTKELLWYTVTVPVVSPDEPATIRFFADGGNVYVDTYTIE